MKVRSIISLLLCLLLAAGIWLLWPRQARTPHAHRTAADMAAALAVMMPPTNSVPAHAAKTSVVSTNPFPLRLANTTKTIGELERHQHAILLENAFIDTDLNQSLKIPTQLHHNDDPGAYIVQARRTADAEFRSLLSWAGAQVVSYIPNNAYLVRISASGAGSLAGSPLVQAVLPYEPYYKVQTSLLQLAVDQKPLPGGTVLTLGLFANTATATEAQIESMGGTVVGRDRSPFGPILRVQPPVDWIALAQLSGVQIVEVANRRMAANDLARVNLGISVDTVTNANYLNLSGSNVVVEVNDTGIDATHPDFSLGGSPATGEGSTTPSRLTGDSPLSLMDTNGHGTHVAGIIAGNGDASWGNVTPPSINVGGVASGSITNADFRGKAPLANLYSVAGINGGYDPFAISDYYLQSVPALTNALISNNSWGNGDSDYDLAAASYDAATRDALPLLPGSQPVLFVFAAGNNGNGSDAGSSGSGDTISAPGTAKDVITVGSLEQLRNITNIVTDASSNKAAVWQPETDSSSQVAWSSSRGNVGIGTEGTFGRFKPDVVAPGAFVVSTRSSQWNTNVYYNPTNDIGTVYRNQTLTTNALDYFNVTVPANAVAVLINVIQNHSTTTFPTNLPIYVLQSGLPTTNSSDFVTSNNAVAIPPDNGGAITGITYLQNSGFWFGVGDSTSAPVNCDITVDILTTNNLGNYYTVLEGLNDSLGQYYRYESGTSMAAAGVSSMLALIQDYFTNTLHALPSPALMKALLINGSRPVGNYTYSVTNGINFQGWGQPNIVNSLPYGNSTNTTVPTNGPIFFVDQSPANALATGDSHTYIVTLDTNNYAEYLPLQITLAWTDPAGNPAAAIKLVNNLDLVVTNLDTGDVFYGNDFAGGVTYNNPWDTNATPNLDLINNVENVFLAPLLGSSYSITVIGRDVNVNAVTAQTNSVVQDFALVVTCGEGELPTAITTVTDSGIVSLPTSDQQITFVATTNSPLYNQFAGENSPLLGTNNLPIGPNTIWGTNGILTVGMTNQWHFYVITNTGLTSDTTNAAFITFLPGTLSLPRIGVFADSLADSTRPESDIDLFATTDPNLTNLSPVTISNCVYNVGDNHAALTREGTEFVYFIDSAPGTVYYVGVKSEDHMGSEYDFFPIFTATPFSQNDHGNLLANGLLLPTQIPDGSNAHPGVTNVIALAIPALGGLDPNMTVAKVTITNLIEHQNYGDLYGAINFSGTTVIMNNHAGLHNTFGAQARVYDDSRNANTNYTVHTDGPGSNLRNYIGKTALGPWIQYQADEALTHTGQISAFSLEIQPHKNFKQPGVTVTVPAGGWFIDFVDVPVGFETLNLYATNTTTPYATQPVQMYEKFGDQPTLTDFDQEQNLTNCLPNTGIFPTGKFPGNSISTGPPLPMGLYYLGLYNPSAVDQQVFISYSLIPVPVIAYYTTNGPASTILDDAVTDSSLLITSTQQIAAVSVGMVIDTTRLSDLAITLVNQTTGQRILLMENRGGTDTNNAGSEFVYTNVLNATASGGYQANTNMLDTGRTAGSVPITYNFYSVPDEMTVYYGTNITPANLVLDTGMINNPGSVPVTITATYPPAGATSVSTILTVIMNQFGNTNGIGGDLWDYTVGAPVTNYQYLTFTEDTNLATVPIKYGIPPFQSPDAGTNYTLADFESSTNFTYVAPTNIPDAQGGWTVPTNAYVYSYILTNSSLVLVTNNIHLTNNEVSVVTDTNNAFGGSNFLALANGTITRTIPTVPGRSYNISYWYRGPGIDAWWRGEGNATDSSDPENNANNGSLIGRFTFPGGEVGQAFGMINPGQNYVYAGTNAYVQIPQRPTTSTVTIGGSNVLVQTSPLDVGTGPGFTVEGWINPTNVGIAQPMVEWLARVPTNALVTNLVITAGPFLSAVNSHYYYLLATTNLTTSEYWAEQLGGHLATVRNANEENWIYDRFANYGGRNRNLWIGFTNSGAGTGWLSGETNLNYYNWRNDQPLNPDGTRNYTGIMGVTNNPAGQWVLTDNRGFIFGSAVTNYFYGVVEVPDIQTNGVQFWCSVTNGMALTNGSLYANLIDTTNGWHEITSPAGLVKSNLFQYVALTYDTNSGLATLYYNGTNVASTNLGVFIPKTTGDVLLGKDMSRLTNNFFSGEMDEFSIYSRTLSPAEIKAIYNASALTTNRNIGKFDPSITPAVGLAEAVVNIGGVTNLIYGVNKTWEMGSYTFMATTSSVPVQITGLEPGILLDTFTVTEAALTNVYYLPEESMQPLVGDSAYGEWTLEIWDNRVGGYIAGNGIATNSQLVSWQLQFTVQTNPPVTLSPEGLDTNSVPAGQITYFAVTVPTWASYATNILVSASSPVDVLYNQTNLPTGQNPGDYVILANSTGGIGAPVLTTNNVAPTFPPLIPGQTYYLGVRNNGSVSATVVLTVDFDMLTLTNNLPFSSVLTTNSTDVDKYYAFDVTTNAYEATFQLLKLSANADLVVSQGAPLPTLTNAAYGSFNPTNANENIYVLTNSSPVPLSAGRWYLGVFRRDAGPVKYTVVAKELDTPKPTVIELTNGVPFDFTIGPGADLTNFFHLLVTNTLTSTLTNYVGAIHFELYNLSGNGDLTVQTNALPLAPVFFHSSQQSGRIPELIYIHTNSALTNLAADWYLGVPNNEATQISYTILAVIDTNSFPAFPGAEGAGAVSTGGRAGNVYHVTSLGDIGTNTLRDAVSATNRTIVFDVSGTIFLTNGPLVITNSWLTIAGQTAPGDGITIAGNDTVVQNTHDVVLRYLRFRLTNGVAGDALQFNLVSNAIADHISTSWSASNLVSVLNSTNVTVQWSILADSLYDTNTLLSAGSYVRYGGGTVSFHHNLYANNFSGNPLLGDNISLDFVNNVIYNWGLFSGLSISNDAAADFTNQLNYVCNYLIAGADTAFFATNYAITNIAFYGGSTNTWIFQTNNLIDFNNNGILDGAYTGWGMFTNKYTKMGREFRLPPVSQDEAFRAYERVLDFAGTSLEQRDDVDRRQVNGVRYSGGGLITQAGTLPLLNSGFPWLDTSGDGIPDYWKSTFGLVLTNSYNTTLTTNANFIGYSDLEEYLSWLAAPHALTSSNQPVNVDLVRLSGKTGRLTFSVTNAVNGSVYLTNSVDPITQTVIQSNAVAVFIPSNNVSGYASFDYYVTNNDTVAFIGPVTVSVLVSGMTPQLGSITLTNNQPVTNTLGGNSVGWYQVNVPTNAVDATNLLLNLTGPGGSALANLWWSTNVPPSITNIVDVELITNAVAPASAVLAINGTPTLIPGATYYLGVQNTNRFPITDVIEVSFAFLGSNTPPILPTIPTQLVAAGTQMTVTNTAVDYNLPAVVYQLTTNYPADNNPAIDTNGIITWLTSTNDAGTNIIFTTIATDTNSLLSGTNSFLAVVLPAIPIVGPVTNVVGSNSINWFIVSVPTNAIAATNTLLFATLPVNLWYSTNVPPSITNSGDFELLTNLEAGSAVITLTNHPVLMPGSRYLLGVQNTNSIGVTNALEVDFELYFPSAPILPIIPDQVIAAGDTLTITNTATDTNAGTLFYTLTNNLALTAPVIDTNGTITWVTTTNDANETDVLTTTVTNSNTYLAASNRFTVTVLPALIIGPPLTNVVGPNSTSWFLIKVPTNALAATNTLLFATLPVNLLYSTNVPPSITNYAGGDYELLTNVMLGSKVFGVTNTVPVLVPGARYFLGVQNTNSIAITNAISVTFLLNVPPPPLIYISSIVATNRGSTNGYLLTWYAPTNDQFHVQWSPAVAPTHWLSITGVVSYSQFINGTNSQFTFFDDGTRTAGLDPVRFYRLQLLKSPTNTAPYFLQGTPADRYATPSATMTVNNTAGDWDLPAQGLVYSISNSLPGVTAAYVSGNYVISWTPTSAQLGLTNVITTVVTDNGVPAKSVTNSFSVIVTNAPTYPVPVIGSVVVSNGQVKLQWSGSTNEQFQVRWATNLNPPVAWTSFGVTITSTNGVFRFVDTNAPLLMKFYQLLIP